MGFIPSELRGALPNLGLPFWLLEDAVDELLFGCKKFLGRHREAGEKVLADRIKREGLVFCSRHSR